MVFCFEFQSVAGTPLSITGQMTAGGIAGMTAATQNALGKVVTNSVASTVTGIRVLTPSMVPSSAIRVTPTTPRQTSN